MESIGPNLKRLRKSRGLSLRKLAKLTHLSHSFIADIESGRSMPSLNTTRVLAEALGVPTSELLNEPNPENPETRSPHYEGAAESLTQTGNLPEPLSPELRRLVQKARELRPEELAAVQQLLDTMSKGKRTCVHEPPPGSELATQAAHRTDDPTRELPEEARRSLTEFKQHIRKKYGKKKPATDG